MTDAPLAVGFGIRTPADVAAVGAIADGVIVAQRADPAGRRGAGPGRRGGRGGGLLRGGGRGAARAGGRLGVIAHAVPPAAPVVWVQAGHEAPREPGYTAQTGAGSGPFGTEVGFTTRVAARVTVLLRRYGVDARRTPGRVTPLGARGAVFVEPPPRRRTAAAPG